MAWVMNSGPLSRQIWDGTPRLMKKLTSASVDCDATVDFQCQAFVCKLIHGSQQLRGIYISPQVSSLSLESRYRQHFSN